MTAYETVLFDNDGVLVTPPTPATQAAATRAAFRECGVTDPAADHVQAIMDGVTEAELHAICATYDIDPESFWTAREQHDEQSQFDDFRTGARDVYPDVDALDDLPGRRGIVSNNHHTTIEFVLEFFDLHAAFDTYYGRAKTVESLSLKKPNTHYLDRAMADLDAETALYVGDSASDVVAADRAGLDSVLVRRDHARDVSPPVAPTFEAADLYDVRSIVTRGAVDERVE